MTIPSRKHTQLHYKLTFSDLTLLSWEISFTRKPHNKENPHKCALRDTFNANNTSSSDHPMNFWYLNKP